MERRELLKVVGFLPFAVTSFVGCTHQRTADFEITIEPSFTDRDYKYIDALLRSGNDAAVDDYIAKRLKVRPVKGR